MSRYRRPRFRQIFRAVERQPRVYFYTSNIDKYLQARIVLERAGLQIRHFRSQTEPYAEEYERGKRELLQQALHEILRTLGSSVFLFVEDTSLRIEALSAGEDVPGLRVKEWFQETSFESLDRDLRIRRNDRRAAVKSDIALHLPGLERPVFFHGETAGTVAETVPDFAASTEYPWLRPDSFNGWFIPDGAVSRLGEMSLDESWEYDFRIQACEAMVDRLEEYTAVLNLPSQGYARRSYEKTPDQQSLFGEGQRVLAVVGETCAGKTTFGEYSRSKHRTRFIDASDVMRSFRATVEDEGKSDLDFARELLEGRGGDVVARRIIGAYREEPYLVIAGFRTIEELAAVRSEFESTEIVLISASERTRFARYLARRRNGRRQTIDQFREIDLQQRQFGLLRVVEDLADIRIENEGRIDEYHRQIDAVVRQHAFSEVKGVAGLGQRHTSQIKNQVYRCLVVLNDAGRPLSCDEIEELTARGGSRILHNNANKVLKAVPELALRHEAGGRRIRYEIRNAGKAYIQVMNWKSRRGAVREEAE